MKPTKRRIFCAVLVSAAVATSGVATAAPARTGCRGALLSSTVVDRIPADKVGEYLRKADLDPSRARFGVIAERIEYRTVGVDGRPTVASGLVARPDGNPVAADLVSWAHGTMIYRGYAPSVSSTDSTRSYAALFASAGYVTSAPDYLGLGTGPGAHPYLDVNSETTASIDALRATKQLAARERVRTTDRVLATGFSQGGPAAMALGRALSRGADPHLKLAALAPISGPYALSDVVAKALSDEISDATAYTSYFTVAWNRLHHLYDSPAEAFRDPAIVALFDGNHPDHEVFPKLPTTVGELLTPQFIEKLKHPTGELRRALRVADATCDWRPGVPVRLFAASGDHTVPISNSRTCAERLRENHGTAEVVDVGAVDHLPSAKRASSQILALFQAA
ncbi:lipase [Amycolatopsis minnesotensis]|uniref:Alpha/beta fold hydrolase n=1 Tax=Amycolatopsis minnesotensis TaxID=337894 RepID=A0ABN2QYZ8_9PSEU